MIGELGSGGGIRLRGLMLGARRRRHLLGVRGWGLLCDMRVLGGPLDVFLEIEA